MVAHRRAIERQYNGRMTVTAFVTVEIDSETMNIKQVLLTDVPCRLQRSQNKSANVAGVHANIDYDVKILCAPELNIPAGCVIEVRQDGMDYEFKHTGEPFKYVTHQEISVSREVST